MKEGTLGCLVVIGIVVLVIVLSVVGFVLNWTGRVYNRVASPEVMITQYEWYEQQVKDIKASEGRIKDAEDAVKRFKEDSGQASGWTFDQREEYARLNSHVTGLRQFRRGMVADYNAKAAMITRNLWKHNSLPYHLEE